MMRSRRRCLLALAALALAGAGGVAAFFRFTWWAPVVVRSESLAVRARHADRATCEGILAAAERVRRDLAKSFGRDPPERLTILFVAKLEGAMGAYAEIWPFGDCFVAEDAIAPVLAPRFEPLIRHEMAHFFVARTIGTVPRWYNEGLAEYLCYGRSWRAHELADLPLHAAALDEKLLVDLVRSDAAGFLAIDARGAQVKDRRFVPARHYDLSRLVLAALEADGWPIAREDPSPRIAADPAAVVAAVRRYALRDVWARVLSDGPVEGLDPPLRAGLAEALGRAECEGADAALRTLARDPEADVRDRAAASLFRRGDRSYAARAEEIRRDLAGRDGVTIEELRLLLDVEESLGGK